MRYLSPLFALMQVIASIIYLCSLYKYFEINLLPRPKLEKKNILGKCKYIIFTKIEIGIFEKKLQGRENEYHMILIFSSNYTLSIMLEI